MNELSITYNKEDMELLRFTPLSIDDEARQKRAKAMAAHYSHPIEIPNLYKQMRVAVYIRYFNSADIEDWLDAMPFMKLKRNNRLSRTVTPYRLSSYLLTILQVKELRVNAVL